MKFKQASVLIIYLAIIFDTIMRTNKILSNTVQVTIDIFIKKQSLEIFKYLGIGIVELGALIFAIFVSGMFLQNIKNWFWEDEDV